LPWHVEKQVEKLVENQSESASETLTEGEDKSWECIGSSSGVRDGHSESLADNRPNATSDDKHDPTRDTDARCRDKSRDDAKRRKTVCSFDSRRLHFLSKQALRRARRRAFCLARTSH
jgi:hypothetical protein